MSRLLSAAQQPPRLPTVPRGLAQSRPTHVLSRHTARRQAVGVASLPKKIEAETRMRDLLEEHGLPEPDRVEYGYTCIRLFFEESRTVLIIDLDPE